MELVSLLLVVSRDEYAAVEEAVDAFGPPYWPVLGRQLVPASDRQDVLAVNTGPSNGTDTGANSIRVFTCQVDALAVAFMFSSFTNLLSQAALSNEISITAGVVLGGTTHSAGATYPLFFGGSRTLVLAPDTVAISDVLAIPVPRGTAVAVWTHVSVTSGGKFPLNSAGDETIGEGQEIGTSVTDKTLAGTIAPAYGFGFGPAMMLAPSTPGGKRAVVVVGDSIATGNGEEAHGPGHGRQTCNWAFARRAALTAGRPFVRASYPSETSQAYANPASATRQTVFRRLFATMAPNVLLQDGVNDLSIAGRTVAQVQADWLTAWFWHSRVGQSVFRTTLTPRTHSTDGWVTAANQTAYSSEASRVALNDWLRDGAPIDAATKAAVSTGTASNVLRSLASGGPGASAAHPLTGLFDTADAVETARNSGRWRAAFEAVATTTSGSVSVAVGEVTSGTISVGMPIFGTGIPAASFVGAYSDGAVSLVNAFGVAVAATTGGTGVVGGRCTADGIHPQTIGHAAMATAVDDAKFV